MRRAEVQTTLERLIAAYDSVFVRIAMITECDTPITVIGTDASRHRAGGSLQSSSALWTSLMHHYTSPTDVLVLATEEGGMCVARVGATSVLVAEFRRYSQLGVAATITARAARDVAAAE